MLKMKEILILSLLAHPLGVNLETIKGMLLYEDQKENICNSWDCWNALTLKNKHYEMEKKMDDFTVCFRINLLSYRGKGYPHNLLRARTNKMFENDGGAWATGFHYELLPVDGTGNGVITIQTFLERLQEVIAENGVYTIWPIYDTEVNANQWNSFCFGSNLCSRNLFLVRNGKTLTNFSQPEIWGDLNIGLDTSALEPFQVNLYLAMHALDILLPFRQKILERASIFGEELIMESFSQITGIV